MLRRRRAGRKDRAFRRYNVTGVTGALKTVVDVEVLDISATGMQVATGSYLAVGRSYPLILKAGESRLEMPGTVRWCSVTGTEKISDDEHRTRYTAGISFAEASHELREELMHMVQPRIELEMESPITGSFQLDDSTSVVADLDFDFKLRRLSLSGMLIESDFAPVVDASFFVMLDLGPDTFATTGRAAYVKPAEGDRQRSEIGVEFLDLNDDDRATLERLITSDFCARDPEVDRDVD